MSGIDTFFAEQVAAELEAWSKRAGVPSDIKIEGIWLFDVESRHGAMGFVWTAEFTGPLDAKGWMSFDGQQFDMDKRPDE